MQETHSWIGDESIWQQEFRGKCLFSHGETNARGVAIMIKENSQIAILKTFGDSQGRMVGMQFEFQGEKMVLINIYAPNADTPNFFLEIFKKFEEFEGKRILIGDYNLAMNVKINRSDSKAQNNDQAREIIEQYIEDTYMTDVWRDRNENVKMYTYCRAKPHFIGSRIDFALTDIALNSWIKNIKILPGFKTDHSSIMIDLESCEMERGRGMWRMNGRILYEMEFLEKIKKSTERVMSLSDKMTKRERWEMLKLNIIGEAQQYSNERANNRKLIMSQLEDKIMEYEKRRNQQILTEDEAKLYLRTKNDFNEILDERAQGAIFRSGQAYYSMGEKSTKYFFALEKARSAAKGMNVILKEGQVIKNQQIIMKELYKFYKKLYTTDPNVEFHYENNSNVKVNEEMKETLEGEITMKELKQAVTQLKRGKSPGCDGIIAEFYMINIRIIKEPLLEAINEGYREGKLHESALRGIITLIPKRSSDTRRIESLRPITLLNNDYKLIEKCLANRLKPVLSSLINEDQKGFLTGRSISCNIRRVLDMIGHVDMEDAPGVILQIDFMKCFDRVEIGALVKSMEYSNIGGSFINWTKTIYNETKSCVINNGNYTEWFEVTRSVVPVV